MRKQLALALLIGFVVIAFPIYWITNQLIKSSMYPSSEAGVLDLREWDFQENGIAPLKGEWELYKEQLLTPSDFHKNGETASNPVADDIVEVPGIWNHYMAQAGETGADGYATYRLRVMVEDQGETVYGIKTNNIRSSNRIFVNGTEVGASGVPGKSSKQGTQDNIPYVGVFTVSGGEVEVIVQVANYSYASGGMVYAITFGDYKSILRSRDANAFGDILTAVCFMVSIVYFFVLYRLRRQEKQVLYLGGFAVAALVYVLTHGEKLIGFILPSAPYELVLRLQLIATTLVYYFIVHYIATDSPAMANRRVMHIVKWTSGIQVLIALTISPFLFSQWGTAIYMLNIGLFLYVVFLMAGSLRFRSMNVLFMLMNGISIMVVVAVNLMNVYGLMENQLLSSYGILLFVMTQAFHFAYRYAGSFRKVEQLSQKLLTLDELKNDFMANTSHELRTPLHGIVNMASSLMEGIAGDMNPKQRHHLSIIMASGKRLSLLVNDILDWAKLKNGDVVLKQRHVELRSIVSTILEVFRHSVGNRKLEWVQQWPDELPLLRADEDRLQQILYNLIGNAVKFTREGMITISADVEGPMIVITVADTGIGIAPDRLETIFLSFNETLHIVDDVYNPAGMGLGLSITKKLVELGGGTIWAESELGRGAVFKFTVPAASSSAVDEAGYSGYSGYSQSHQPAIIVPTLESDSSVAVTMKQAAASKEEAARGLVLIVDDDPINLQVLRDILIMDDYDVIAAETGAEALVMLDKTDRAEVELVITDWMMPEMSGLELSRTIRLRYSLSELPVLMLTARGRAEEIELAFRSGINDFLSKPVEASELRARVRTLIELRRSAQNAVRTEMAFLQAQIKPHFLYNSLNTIIYMSKVNPSKATQLLTELSTYLRGSFDFQSHDKLIPLQKELELIKAYLTLEGARFEERLQVQYEIEASPNLLLPPLAIQPIVENAVRHGIMQKAAGGTIKIKVWESEEALHVLISDDGVGMSGEQLTNLFVEKPGSGSGVGLVNINRRLRSLYGEELHVASEPLVGSEVGFKLPRSSMRDYEASKGDQDVNLHIGRR